MAEEEYELTNADWGKIHAKAWREPKNSEGYWRPIRPRPCRDYAQQDGLKFNQNSEVAPRARSAMTYAPEFWDDVNPFPPSCC